jgi:hypothetical protein
MSNCQALLPEALMLLHSRILKSLLIIQPLPSSREMKEHDIVWVGYDIWKFFDSWNWLFDYVVEYDSPA